MSEYASREYARSSSSAHEQSTSIDWLDPQIQQALQKLKAARQQSFSFIKVSHEVIEIKIDVTADGDRELYMKFSKNGDKVQVQARYKDQASPQVSFEISPRQPKLFFLWHHVTSYGSEPFRLFFSLSPEQRAFLNNYKNLPPELQASLAQEVSADKGNIHEKVTGTGDQATVSAPNRDTLPYMTPTNLPGLDLQDQLAIGYQQDPKDHQKATYTFVHNGKKVDSLTVHKFSKADNQANFIVGKDELPASGGTFSIPFTVNKGLYGSSFAQCTFVFVPTQDDEVLVAFKRKGGTPWPDTFRLKLPYDYNRGLKYSVTQEDDHLLIEFQVPKGVTLKSPARIKVYYQIQNQLDASLDPATLSNHTQQEELQHRVEALHVYTNQAQGKGWAASYEHYYRQGVLQASKSEEKTSTHLMVQAADHARKHLHADTKKRTVDDIHQELTMQEEGYIQQFWQSAEGQNFDWQLAKGEVKDTLTVKGATLYKAYQAAYSALLTLIPLVGEAKRKEGTLPMTPKLKFMTTYTQRQLWRFEQYCQRWLKQARRSGIDSLVPLPTARQNLPQLLGTGKGLEKVNMHEQLEMYHNVMMAMTQYAQIDLIDQGIANTKKKYKAWLDQHKLGDEGSVKAEKNREKDVKDLTNDLPVKKRQKTAQVKESRSLRKNFVNYVQKEVGNQGATIVKIPALYYPETENLKNEAGKNKKYAAIGAWLDKNPLVVMDIPMYAYLKGSTWYAVSLVNRAKGKYYHQPYTLTTEEEKKRYARYPPPALFDSMNEKDHLPPGYIMYQIPGAKGTAPRPVHIQNKMTLDEIMTQIALWAFVGGLVVATGGAATGAMPLLAEAGFAIATIAGGVAGYTSYQRKTKNGTMSQEDKVIALADMAAALLAIPQWRGLRQLGGFLVGNKAKAGLNHLMQAQAVASWQGQFYIKTADLGVDGVVIAILGKQGIDKTIEIMQSPGSDDDRAMALTKLWGLLAIQKGMFVGTLKARFADLGQTLAKADLALQLRTNSQQLKKTDATNYVAQVNAKGIWQLDEWNTNALNLEASALQATAKTLHELPKADAQALRALFPQEALLTQLVQQQGNLKATRAVLDERYGVNNQAYEAVQKLYAQGRWQLNARLIDHAQLTAQEVHAIAKRLNGMDDTTAKVTKDIYGEDNLLYMLYVHRGNYRKATDELHTMYGINPKEMFDNLRHAETQTYSKAVKPAEDDWKHQQDLNHITQQRLNTAQKDLKAREQFKEAVMSDRKWDALQEKSYQKQIRNTQQELKDLDADIKHLNESIIAVTKGMDMSASPHGIKTELHMLQGQLQDTRGLLRQTREQLDIKKDELKVHNKAYNEARQAYTAQFWKNNQAMKKYKKLKAAGKPLSATQEKRMKITLKNRERQLERKLANPDTKIGANGESVEQLTNNIARTQQAIDELAAKAKKLTNQAEHLQGRLNTAQTVDELNWGKEGLVNLHKRKQLRERGLAVYQEELTKASESKRRRNQRLNKEIAPGLKKSREDLASIQHQKSIADDRTQRAQKKFAQDKKHWETTQHQAHLLRAQLKLKQAGKRLSDEQAQQALTVARELKGIQRLLQWSGDPGFNADLDKGIWSLVRTIISLMGFPDRYSGDYDQRYDLQRQVTQATTMLQAELKLLNYAQKSGFALPPHIQKRYAQALQLSKDLSQIRLVKTRGADQHQRLQSIGKKVHQCLQRMQLHEQIWESMQKK